MVTEDFAAAGGAAALTGGAPLPVERPFGRPMLPNAGSRGPPAVGLFPNGGIAPLPVYGGGWRREDCWNIMTTIACY